MMPGLSGYDVIRELKDNPSTHDIPVIFLTAMSAAEDEKKGLELGQPITSQNPSPLPSLRRVSKHSLKTKEQPIF